MKKALTLLVGLAALVGGGIYFGKIDVPADWAEKVPAFVRSVAGSLTADHAGAPGDFHASTEGGSADAPRWVPVGGDGHSTAAAPVTAGETITVASFNIQVFGESKLAKPEVMDVLAEVVRRFDVVAIQEVRAKRQDVLPRFVSKINAGSARYDFAIGPRLGRTSSKEQYAFVYDTSRIELDRSWVYTVPDPNDRLHRPPFVARFRARGPPPAEAFSFMLVNIHTDPDETDEELDALDDVFRQVQRDNPDEDDVILLGDLNVDDRHLGELGAVSNIAWIVSGTTTNTRRNKLYDNIVFDRVAGAEFTGRWGVFDLAAEFGISTESALRVSDHLPVWAEFTARERRATDVAGRPLPAAR